MKIQFLTIIINSESGKRDTKLKLGFCELSTHEAFGELQNSSAPPSEF